VLRIWEQLNGKVLRSISQGQVLLGLSHIYSPFSHTFSRVYEIESTNNGK